LWEKEDFHASLARSRALVILFAVVWPFVEHFWLWPRPVRAVEANEPEARSGAYARTLLEQWALAAAVMALPFSFGRPRAIVGLRLPQGW
jgi:hypothetical protein